MTNNKMDEAIVKRIEDARKEIVAKCETLIKDYDALSTVLRILTKEEPKDWWDTPAGRKRRTDLHQSVR